MGLGLADLSQSIFASLGLPGVDNQLNLSPSRRSALLLVDGMGSTSLEKYSSQFPIFNQVITAHSLQSHFPSTTVTNLTSLGTGELPGVHGMLGYTVRVPNSGTPGRLLNALKWDDRVDPLFWQKVPTLFERAKEHGITVTNIAEKRYEGSAFTQAALRGADYVGANHAEQMVEAAVRALAEPNSFTYLYINVTADHGMVNVSEKIILGVENNLMQNVTLVGGEPRARHIYLRDGALEETLVQWREFLGNRAAVHSKSEAISAGLFGSQISEDSFDRMGDLVVIANDEVILIDPTRISQESAMVGHHGGITESETVIPLLKFL